jgi:hypothetical protein
MTHAFGDIALNDNFEAFINARGDLADVSGRERFEQALGVRLAVRYDGLIGEVNKKTIAERVRLDAQRVAERMDELENIAGRTTTYPDDRTNVLELTITYETGDQEIFEVQG